MKYKQSNDVSTLAQKYLPVFKKTAANSERVTHVSHIKLISWVALYMIYDFPIIQTIIIQIKIVLPRRCSNTDIILFYDLKIRTSMCMINDLFILL